MALLLRSAEIQPLFLRFVTLLSCQRSRVGPGQGARPRRKCQGALVARSAGTTLSLERQPVGWARSLGLPYGPGWALVFPWLSPSWPSRTGPGWAQRLMATPDWSRAPPRQACRRPPWTAQQPPFAGLMGLEIASLTKGTRWGGSRLLGPRWSRVGVHGPGSPGCPRTGPGWAPPPRQACRRRSRGLGDGAHPGPPNSRTVGKGASYPLPTTAMVHLPCIPASRVVPVCGSEK